LVLVIPILGLVFESVIYTCNSLNYRDNVLICDDYSNRCRSAGDYERSKEFLSDIVGLSRGLSNVKELEELFNSDLTLFKPSLGNVITVLSK
jgi:hypothetical protein